MSEEPEKYDASGLVTAEWVKWWDVNRRSIDNAEPYVNPSLQLDIDAILAEAIAPWKEAVRELLDGPAVCDCDESYTARGRHEPNAVHSDYADTFERLRALLDTP